jgi:hypothetical protein
LPDADAEVGHCVHRIALHPSRPGVLFMQKHWDVLRSDNAGDQWREVSGNLPEGKLRVYRSKTGGGEWEALTKGLPQKDCYVNVLRDAMAVDQLDPCGIYFGTSGGQLYGSADGGDSWQTLAEHLPGILSVEVQTLK